MWVEPRPGADAADAGALAGAVCAGVRQPARSRRREEQGPGGGAGEQRSSVEVTGRAATETSPFPHARPEHRARRTPASRSTSSGTRRAATRCRSSSASWSGSTSQGVVARPRRHRVLVGDTTDCLKPLAPSRIAGRRSTATPQDVGRTDGRVQARSEPDRSEQEAIRCRRPTSTRRPRQTRTAPGSGCPTDEGLMVILKVREPGRRRFSPAGSMPVRCAADGQRRRRLSRGTSELRRAATRGRSDPATDARAGERQHGGTDQAGVSRPDRPSIQRALRRSTGQTIVGGCMAAGTCTHEPAASGHRSTSIRLSYSQTHRSQWQSSRHGGEHLWVLYRGDGRRNPEERVG